MSAGSVAEWYQQPTRTQQAHVPRSTSEDDSARHAVCSVAKHLIPVYPWFCFPYSIVDFKFSLVCSCNVMHVQERGAVLPNDLVLGAASGNWLVKCRVLCWLSWLAFDSGIFGSLYLLTA